MKRVFLISGLAIVAMTVMFACEKDDGATPNTNNNVDKSGFENQNDKVSVIQNQIVGTDWYLECKIGVPDYNDSKWKHDSYFTFAEDMIYSINASDGNKKEWCSYGLLGDTAFCWNHFMLCQAGEAYATLSNDTLYVGFYKGGVSMYFVRKEVVDNAAEIKILKSDEETGDMCITVKDYISGIAKDSCFSVGVPYGLPSVVVGKIYVRVGEGENEHDSLVYEYAPSQIHPAPNSRQDNVQTEMDSSKNREGEIVPPWNEGI